MKKILLTLLLMATSVLIVGLYFQNISENELESSTQQHPLTNHSSDEYHVHVDFLVVLNDSIINFSKEEFMSDEIHSKNHGYVHLHNNIDNVIHFHKENLTLQTFFKSLDMNFTNSCFVTDDNSSYCKDSINSLNLYVNGSLIKDYQNYVPNDLDQILLLYGSYSQEEIEKYQSLVSDDACIHSNICKERIPEDFVSDAQGSCVTGFSCGGDALDFLNN